MSDLPARRLTPRVDLDAADVGTLVAMGRIPAPPVASVSPPVRPGVPLPVDTGARTELLSALSAAGVAMDPAASAAVDDVASDPATAATVAGWLRGKKGP